MLFFYELDIVFKLVEVRSKDVSENEYKCDVWGEIINLLEKYFCVKSVLLCLM